MKFINDIVCKNLKKKIAIREITQTDLALFSGYSLSTINRYVRGGTDYNVRILNDICNVLGCDISELFKEVNKNE